jgi:hypothetical protein
MAKPTPIDKARRDNKAVLAATVFFMIEVSWVSGCV